MKISKNLFRHSMSLIIGMVFISMSAFSQQDTTLQNTLPDRAKLIDGKPVGKGWQDLLKSADSWVMEDSLWKLVDGVLVGEMGNVKEHHYSYTKKKYTDFELNVMIKMEGDENANSGVCVRINPTNFDNAPGYQVDMGKGYWGSLWEERRDEMVQLFPQHLVTKIVKQNDWNHYYIIAKGHHIQAWLNGVKTIDVVHEKGFLEGNIGFQLCHYHTQTKVQVKSLFMKPI